MRHRVVILSLVVFYLSARAPAATNEQIDDAIARGRNYLYAQQTNGTWEESRRRDADGTGQSIGGGQWGGTTAMCVAALLSVGEKPQDERLARAIEFLKEAKLVGVYALGMRCQVWMQLPHTPETRQLMKRDADALLAMMKTKGNARGFYDYTDTGPDTTNYSLSRSQYAVQGLWAAAQMGVEVPQDYWKLVESAWVEQQDEDGGWAYARGGRRDYPITAGITSVAVATLFITQEFLHARDGAECKGNVTSEPIENGIRWLAGHTDEIAPAEKSPRSYPYATLYGVERVGVASGRKYLGKVSWYAKGADWLIERQKKDGSWPTDAFIGNVPDTCYALLFLARGRQPVAVNKLQYDGAGGTPGNWNQRPRDVANLTRWIGRQIEREMHWQVVNLEVPVEELHDAPVLYVAGNQALKLSDEHREKIRAFVETGGLVLANADCAARGFAASFQKLGEELFPAYKFRELPAEHPIYTAQQFRRDKWRTKPSVLGLSNGARELMLIAAQTDPARAWQTQSLDRPEAFQLAADVFLYAADSRNLRYKGDSYLVAADANVRPKRSIEVARLKYDGNWDPEPGGWRRLAKILHNRGVRLNVREGEIAKVDALAPSTRVAHLTGTDAITLDDTARASVKKLVEAGGTLIIDAAGGSTAFAKSIDAELEKMFPGAEPTVLPPDHPVYRGAGDKPVDVRYRKFVARGTGGAPPKVGQLRVIQWKGRPAVYVSREDLSVGLVGNPVDGIVGYEPATATRIMSAVLEAASQERADSE